MCPGAEPPAPLGQVLASIQLAHGTLIARALGALQWSGSMWNSTQHPAVAAEMRQMDAWMLPLLQRYQATAGIDALSFGTKDGLLESVGEVNGTQCIFVKSSGSACVDPYTMSGQGCADATSDCNYGVQYTAWYESGVSKGEAALTEVYSWPRTGGMGFSAVAPAYKAGALAGVWSVDVPLGALNERLTALSGEFHGVLFIASLEGRVLAASSPEATRSPLQLAVESEDVQLAGAAQLLCGAAEDSFGAVAPGIIEEGSDGIVAPGYTAPVLGGPRVAVAVLSRGDVLAGFNELKNIAFVLYVFCAAVLVAQVPGAPAPAGCRWCAMLPLVCHAAHPRAVPGAPEPAQGPHYAGASCPRHSAI